MIARGLPPTAQVRMVAWMSVAIRNAHA
jgi:hypothetical protein